MPYIKQEDRIPVAEVHPINAGELNYAITKLCIGYLGRMSPNYGVYNAIVGALECAKQEFYRRSLVPYEDKKIEENGDVYP
jgi:hypothetical protein